MAEKNISEQGNRRAWIWYGILLVLFFFAIFLLWKVISLQDRLQDFHAEQSELMVKIDSLRTSMKAPSVQGENFESLISLYDLRQLRQKGLDNPIDDLKSNLVKNADLIPYEGTLGGTMHFYREMMYVLTGKWMLAYFEDGHRAGYMLLEYEVDPQGNIQWEVVDVYLG